MIRKFFFACAGLLCLTLAYQLGVTAARAQIQNTIWSSDFGDLSAGVVVGRTIQGISVQDGRHGALPPVPGSAEIVQFSIRENFSEGLAVLANGDVYRLGNGGSGWVLVGNVLAGATGSRPSSWGALKASGR